MTDEHSRNAASVPLLVTEQAVLVSRSVLLSPRLARGLNLVALLTIATSGFIEHTDHRIPIARSHISSTRERL